ncbi:hypothetical protein HaLaN_11228 [Haematococcus lacustris]|uniref:Uncharacterized protein n=1 Tax=Haematococcus lacustris TaxID=44745 RepID=A0A699Z774_HAELA|nr:hypothetical protein HaLaN_11228 [Haematococcus lacustris]
MLAGINQALEDELVHTVKTSDASFLTVGFDHADNWDLLAIDESLRYVL